ncbi:MAG: hypothetical protein U0835_21545 [Isosphaeraceae bacterium]
MNMPPTEQPVSTSAHAARGRVFGTRPVWGRLVRSAGFGLGLGVALAGSALAQEPGSNPFAEKKRQLMEIGKTPASSPSGNPAAPKPKAVGRGDDPVVRPAAPKPPRADLIPIPAGPRTGGTGKSASPEEFWLHYYKTHDDKDEVEKLRSTVGTLNASRKFRDVRAALMGFLTYHAKDAQPWMYSALAIATKMNGGKEADIKTSLGYAADLALKGKNPNDLVSVADQMFLMGQFDRVGPLLDAAMEAVPHRGEPILMSINLAMKTQDPKRLGDSVERLLALGWPGAQGFDEGLRRDARKQVETLAKTLREAGKGDEADALLARLPGAEARDVFVRLTWVGDADLDLLVDEPLGATASIAAPRTVFGGTIVKNGYGKHPEEVYVCPRGFDGEYSVKVETVWNNPEKPAFTATLELITHEGTEQEHKETKTIKLGGKSPSEPVKFTLKDGRRKQALPYVAPSAENVLAAARAQIKPSRSEAKPAAPASAPATKAAKPVKP